VSDEDACDDAHQNAVGDPDANPRDDDDARGREGFDARCARGDQRRAHSHRCVRRRERRERLEGGVLHYPSSGGWFIRTDDARRDEI